MEDVFIQRTDRTPEVDFKASTGIISITGKSIPENPISFYKSLSNWVDRYLEQPKPETVVRVVLEYFNTSTSKCLVDFFKQFERLTGMPDKQIKVEWFYEEDDEEILDAGHDYKDLVDIPFEFKVLKV